MRSEAEAVASNAIVRSELFTILTWFRLRPKIVPMNVPDADPSPAVAKDIEMTAISQDRDGEVKNEDVESANETDTLIRFTCKRMLIADSVTVRLFRQRRVINGQCKKSLLHLFVLYCSVYLRMSIYCFEFD